MIDHTFRRTASGLGLYYGWFEAMHSRLDLLLAGVAEETADALASGLSDEVKRIEKRLNRFDPQSDLWDINESQSGEIYYTDGEMLGFFADASRYRQLTGGAFDIAVGTPGYDPRTDYYYVDAENGALVFNVPGAVFDFGGYAKGYALEKMVEAIRAAGVASGLVSFGNSSVYGIGGHPVQGPWQVGVEHPLRRGVSMTTVELRDGALSSSGNTPRHSGHILSPETGEGVAGRQVISVAGPSPLDCEVLSTALFAARTPEKREAILGRFDLSRVVEMEYAESGTPGYSLRELR